MRINNFFDDYDDYNEYVSTKIKHGKLKSLKSEENNEVKQNIKIKNKNIKKCIKIKNYIRDNDE